MSSKILKLYMLIIFSFFTGKAFATTFIETPVEGRLEVSSGIVRGRFLGSSFKKSPDGKVVTEATFQVFAVSGIEPNEIINRNTFKVTYPGGEWNGLTYKVSGTPNFKEDEEVVLMVSKGKFGFILPDLAFSKFTITEVDGGETLVSSIFSDKEGIGKISLAEFNKMAESKFGSPLVSFNSDTHIHTSKNTYANNTLLENYESREPRERKPASKPKDEDENFNFIWFVLALGVLGFLSNLLLRGREE